jgi:hypothetical protein
VTSAAVEHKRIGKLPPGWLDALERWMVFGATLEPEHSVCGIVRKLVPEPQDPSDSEYDLDEGKGKADEP